ncbi:ANTAR domain-containing response regulator [Thalassotalea euphylliae]|uniref:ANTAR domain-containing response regulator n=1 Tax=Thalassotalea euphylliae TaxID=1655234 RepID=UPI003641AC62
MPNIEIDELSVLLVEDDKRKAALLIEALVQSNYCIRHVTSSGMPLLKQVEQLQPDIILIDIESPNRDMLDSLAVISSTNPKPVIMLSQDEEETIHHMVQSGVSAYVAGGVATDKVRKILDIAIARFNEYQVYRQEAIEAKTKAANQRVVDQAKAWLMESKALTEQEAYHSLRKMAMDNSQKLESVARNIMSLANMLEKSS